nr:T9SS type A sorting domain-containing protein [Candidatus Neomarinimicrobiota bacterium]
TIPVPFGYADGMKIDVDGNIYCTCSSYVWVISPEGELIGKIALPSNVSASNCAWGDDDNRTLFITAGNSVYRVRPFVTSINKEDSSLPNSFGLSQNYPNPFNPTTKITYSIPITSNVMITVYDVSGKEVVTIENCQKKAGTYTLLFNAEKLASGVYYYNLTANEFSSTKKFVILK